MKFSSRKSVLFTILIFGTAVFLIGFSVFGLAFNRIGKTDSWMVIPFLIIAALLLWIYFGTYYQVTETELIYRSGPLRGKIPLNEIREIVKGKTLYAGIKPATAGKGLIIKFGKYDEIYISPDSNDSFILEIGKRNREIVVSG
jgi:hypothetical protein